MPPVKKSQLRLLRPYLVGERPSERSGDGREGTELEWDMYCPLHNDTKRSAQLNVTKGVWYCHAGCGGGSVRSLIDRKDDWIPPRSPESGRIRLDRPLKGDERPAEEITDAKIAGWAEALMSNEAALDDLITSRGIHTTTVREFEIGWDRDRNAYTIPVRDLDGGIVGLRRYQIRPPKGRRKIWGVQGMNSPRLYPIKTLTYGEEIIVCEGELDALITTQYGFPSVTRTAAAKVWRGEWNKLFKGKIVYVCHDCDETGQDANRRVARSLRKVAADVRIIRLPYPITEKHGKDLTDWWLEHDSDIDEFKRLLEEALPYEPGAEEPERLDPHDASVLDALDSRRVGRALRLTVTIKGKRDPGYSVPRRALYQCTRDKGQVCNVCPMFATGEEERVIAGSDPVILELMDSTNLQIRDILRRSSGIPKCEKLTIDVREYQAVEVLYARPSVDHMNGSGAGDYKNLKLTSVGRHDTMPNNTVRVVGALHPDPRKQLNEFLAWDVAQMETTLDRFEMTGEVARRLRKFQPRAGERPLMKLRRIADDLADHVTKIYGRPEMHALMDLTFHSVVSFNFGGKRVHRGWIDSVVVGDTRTGKSEAATRLSAFYRAGEVVSCEAASFAGIIGGLQQYGATKEWAISWGSIPINDRRLVVLDEAGGLTPEEIAAMSSVRSSGIAELTKIQQERTYARTRLIWLANPRNGRMQDYTYGVQALQPLIGNAEDIARFDLAMTVRFGEVPSDVINREHTPGRQRYTSEDCATLLRWAWSRTSDQVVWGRGAERAVYYAARQMGRRYVEDPPLIQVANVREKLARVAVALAARLFSTDESCERIIVTREHVKDAVSFIDRVYGMRGFGYAERSKEIIQDRRFAEKQSREIKQFLYNKPNLAKFLRTTGKFRRQDVEEVLNADREQANAVISTLWEARMVRKDKGDVRVEPTLHELLREINI